MDDAIWNALTGPHAGLALREGRAARYPAAVSPFAGLAARDAGAFADLARLVPAEDVVGIFSNGDDPGGPHWKRVQRIELIRMVCDVAVAPPQREPGGLSNADVGDMVALAELARPGPFGPRTIEMGRYIGLRDAGRLVAMGGERLKPPGQVEVSAICTAPDFRGRGLAETIVRALVASIQARGLRPFLHVMQGSPSEAGALALYTRLGFRDALRPTLVILQRTAAA